MPKQIIAGQLAKKGLIKEAQPISLSPILREIKKNRKLPSEERDYLRLYFSLENFIINSNLGYTPESLRENIKSRFNTQWFPPRIKALFNLKEPDRIVFSGIILEAILKHLSQNLDPGAIQNKINETTRNQLLQGIIITKEKIDLDIAEKRIFASEEQFDKAIKEINELLTELYKYSVRNIGAFETKKIFGNAFNEIKTKYSNIPKFIDVVRALPAGILEEERFDLLSREELENISRRLAKIDLMKSEFTNIAAHELKTPLVPLMGFLERLNKDPKRFKLTGEVQKQIEICLRNAKKLNSLVDDILSISLLETGEMKFEMGDLNIIEIVSNTKADLLDSAQEKSLSLNVIMPSRLPTIRGDKQRISQVLNNLVSNAIKYTNDGSVTISAKQKGKKVIIHVKDTGIGIDKKNIPNLFAKYYRTDTAETRKQKGAGLGLAICKGIIEKHSGSIGVKSALGKGSTFYITLPIKK